MVRFIIRSVLLFNPPPFKFTFQYGQIYYQLSTILLCQTKNIYIPIWLDLLFYSTMLIPGDVINLHSNMVRFIMPSFSVVPLSLEIFTFQYGQIYYILFSFSYFFFYFIYIPIWLDLLFYCLRIIVLQHIYLHSNMVRFIIITPDKYYIESFKFTFQYGQIYYYIRRLSFLFSCFIYIPIWLDLLFFYLLFLFFYYFYLHSNMVRFIMFFGFHFGNGLFQFTFQYGQIYYIHVAYSIFFSLIIYIPIWLDLLFFDYCMLIYNDNDLHSNMVRFIIHIQLL